MQPITIQFAVRVGYVRIIQISRENNIIQINPPDGSTNTACLCGRCLGYSVSRFVEVFLIKLIKWTLKLATVPEIFAGQTNSSILVDCVFSCLRRVVE